ncbi:MAG: putative ABC transporter permease [Alistipes sp.]|nr:putative ABC transporter permease [Alistipes sp.]
MYVYTITQWLLFFFVYCFFGWIFETTYVSLKKHRFVNRGFMRGPFLPLYGSGAILILFATIPVRDSYVLMYLFGAVTATILEYATGVVMEKIFKVRYWDYSEKKFNFRGQICLGSSIAWGFLGIFLVKAIHKPIEKLILKISANSYLEEAIVFIVTIYFVADMTVAFKEALELRDLLLYVEKAKAEMERLKKRAEALEQYLDGYRERLSGYNERLVKRFVTAHPTMSSERFKDAVAELKQRVVHDIHKEK